MVVCHVKRGVSIEFLFETSVETNNDSLIRSLCHVHNLRLRLAALADALNDLASHGMANLPQDQRLNTCQEGVSNKRRENVFQNDPLGYPTGKHISSQLKYMLVRVAADAKMILDSKAQIARRICIQESELIEKLENIRKAVATAFPMGLSVHDPIKIMLDADNSKQVLAYSSAVSEVMSEDTAELWWAGKQFFRDQHVRDLTGTNEKTMLVVKLQKRGGGGPGQELGVREEESKAMMAFCSKKQQEQQQAAEDDATDYMMSSWADPKALKNALRANGNIRPF
ncbi:uncharacterized protein CCR75_006050 [Bremia lactucae]|uniref:Uncharacterized protein n=1 Tax=Bremia lactucae TaxID=4779 RepID=A0A976II68_BRELC|nr:hypothetical protein CCR75_006050 [Bremia lactucae]